MSVIVSPLINALLSQDRPLLTWIKRIPQYLAELLRLEGRGEHASAQCVQCGSLGAACYRCEDCTAVGLHCQDCIKAVHLALPLHRIRVSRRHVVPS